MNDPAAPEPRTRELLEVEGLTKEYSLRLKASSAAGQHSHTALAGVSFSVDHGQTLGIIGESGSGKTTAARCILRIIEPSSGSIWFMGEDITTLGGRPLRQARRHMQMVFQNPYGSLDPFRSVGWSIAEPLVAHRIGNRASRRRRVEDLLGHVGLSSSAAKFRPTAFSGGERQRIAIARALALEPALIVCDEPVSALDVSIQAQILNLLRDLQTEFGYAYVFISHDIGVVRAVSDRVVVMKDGHVVESGTSNAVFDSPKDPYTAMLLEVSGHVGTVSP